MPTYEYIYIYLLCIYFIYLYIYVFFITIYTDLFYLFIYFLIGLCIADNLWSNKRKIVPLKQPQTERKLFHT
jgi:hypothetical protein